MKKKYYWIIGIIIITLIILFGFLYTFFSFDSTLSESTSKQVAETTQLMKCCGECIDSFNKFPTKGDSKITSCGTFTTSYNRSLECKTFFENKPRTVSECGG